MNRFTGRRTFRSTAVFTISNVSKSCVEPLDERVPDPAVEICSAAG